tara:strand:- start:238 stop:444 length:207 start_codon:yes stop_codon:yes gene_type:complete
MIAMGERIAWGSDSGIMDAAADALEAAPKNIPVGFLRQWINEDRTHSNQNMVSDEDIMGFIELGYKHQ